MNFFAKGEKKINFLDVLSTAALTAASIREHSKHLVGHYFHLQTDLVGFGLI